MTWAASPQEKYTQTGSNKECQVKQRGQINIRTNKNSRGIENVTTSVGQKQLKMVSNATKSGIMLQSRQCGIRTSGKTGRKCFQKIKKGLSFEKSKASSFESQLNIECFIKTWFSGNIHDLQMIVPSRKMNLRHSVNSLAHLHKSKPWKLYGAIFRKPLSAENPHR